MGESRSYKKTYNPNKEITLKKCIEMPSQAEIELLITIFERFFFFWGGEGRL